MPKENMHEALFYKALSKNLVQCSLCMRKCTIAPDARGFCGVRKNIGGRLYSLVYGKTLTMSIDPIEKKPLYHFRPGSQCLGISTYGCNFSCKHCQNSDISQERSERAISNIPFTAPEKIVENALSAGADGIAYTYTEPTIFTEYALDTMKIAKKKGLYNVWVSNGYMGKECAEEIAPFLDAINIDLKGNARFYKEVCGNADIKFVKENIRLFHKKGIHVEVATLVVPGFNDSEKDFREVSSFIASIDKGMPLHFTRFYPQYKLDYLPATDLEKLRTAKKTALETGLRFVYLGNLLDEEDTMCPKCGSVLIRRMGLSSKVEGLKGNGKCSKCGAKTGIIL